MSTRPRPLVFIITGLSTGGAETMLLKLLERLPRRFEPSVVSLTTTGEIGPRISALGIPVTALGMAGGKPSVRALAQLLSHFRRTRPGLVHTWMYHADLLGGLAAKAAGVPAVAWCIRNSGLDPATTKASTRGVVGACARLSRRVPDRIVTCSEVARRLHVGLGYDDARMVVLPNGFDLARFAPDPAARVSLREELRVPADTPLVGLVGRWDPQKNHAGFCRAAARVMARRPDARFVLAGAGVDEANAALARAADAAGVTPALHRLGLRADIPRLMAGLDVLASSSAYGEAFPNVLGEAMACGVPCAVTDVGDSSYIVGDTGRVVRPDDLDGLGDHVASLLDLPGDARAELGARARRRVEENFEIGHVAGRYAALYDEMLERGRRTGAGG